MHTSAAFRGNFAFIPAEVCTFHASCAYFGWERKGKGPRRRNIIRDSRAVSILSGSLLLTLCCRVQEEFVHLLLVYV